MWYILAGLILLYTAWCLARWWRGRKNSCCGGCGGCPEQGKCKKR